MSTWIPAVAAARWQMSLESNAKRLEMQPSATSFADLLFPNRPAARHARRGLAYVSPQVPTMRASKSHHGGPQRDAPREAGRGDP